MIPQSILDKIKKLDAYPKTVQDFQIKTYGGAAVTMVSIAFALLLFLSELNFYLTPEVTEELLVDVSKGDQLKINFDVTFPHVSCSFLSVDSNDISGDQHININHNIFKRRLEKDTLRPLDQAIKDNSIELNKRKEQQDFLKSVQPTTTPVPLDPDRCESCYGAETIHKKCCNTCADVREAYSAKGWAIRDYNTIIQCSREGIKSSRKLTTEFNLEACQIYGYVEVTRVGGNLHIAPGISMEKNHHHIHDLGSSDSSAINMSHTINHLSFGEDHPVLSTIRASSKIDNPLQGFKTTAEFGSMAFNYYLKIVSTIYVSKYNEVFESSQFAVTRHKKRTDDTMGDGLPGVFFIYELAPMMVKYTETSRSFMHFMTSICAIIGGIFTVAGIIDCMFYHSYNAIKNKIQLGKLS